MRMMRLRFLGLMFLAAAPEAWACSPLSLIALRDKADAIVQAVYTDGEKPGEGVLVVKRHIKGKVTKSIDIRWNVNFEDDGVNCPEWRPTWKKQKGKFYLSRNPDGTFSVLMSDVKKVKS
jgi:hypothetical protein